MLREQGEVQRIEGRLARVALRAHGGCGSCSESSSSGGSCQSGSGASSSDRVLEVPLSLPVRQGDRVEVAVPALEQGGKTLVRALWLLLPALVLGSLFEKLLLRATATAPSPGLLLAVAAGGALLGELAWRWRARRHRPRLLRILPRSLPMAPT